MKAIFEKLRLNLFWLADAVAGGTTRHHYADVAALLNGDPAHAEKKKSERLQALLRHAAATTPFYRGRALSLQDFPVINKTLIRENFDQFTSAAFSAAQHLPTVTSGSTGTPFKVLHHADKKKRNSADTLYFAQRTGYHIGDRLLYLKIWSGNNRKGKLQGWMQNMVPVDVISFNDAEIAALIERMENDGSTFAFLGYSSALELIVRWLERRNRGPVKAKVSSILSMSESLNDYTKAGMEQYFGVPAFSRYSNLENGIIAQQVPGQAHRYLINTASYVVEIFKMEADRPAAVGEPGRILVTDLYNHAMPMIRYDTGDVGALSPVSDAHGNRYLEAVEGRKLDLLYATNGQLVSSYIVYKNMWQYTEIQQYQLVQHGEKDYSFRINLPGKFTKEEQLVREFKHYLGEDANFKVEYVNEIPLLASGKRKKIANTFHHQT